MRSKPPCFSGFYEAKVSVGEYGFSLFWCLQAQKDLKNTLKRPFQLTKNRPDTATTPFNGLGFYARNFVEADDYLVILAASAVGVHGNKVLSGRQSAIVHEFNPALIGMRDIGLHDRHWMATTSLLLL